MLTSAPAAPRTCALSTAPLSPTLMDRDSLTGTSTSLTTCHCSACASLDSTAAGTSTTTTARARLRVDDSTRPLGRPVCTN